MLSLDLEEVTETFFDGERPGIEAQIFKAHCAKLCMQGTQEHGSHPPSGKLMVPD